MVKPLALVLFEKLIPGSQLVNRLQDLGYRVTTISDPAALADTAAEAKPMLVVADLVSSKSDVRAGVRQLRANPATSHVPVIAYAKETPADLQAAARDAGVTFLVTETAMLSHLAQFLEQALLVE